MGCEGKPSLWFSEHYDKPAPMHIAFTAPDRKAVDEFYAAAMAAGGKDNGPPGLRPHYHPDYYAAFVIGPDGHNVEAVCHMPAGVTWRGISTSRWRPSFPTSSRRRW